MRRRRATLKIFLEPGNGAFLELHEIHTTKTATCAQTSKKWHLSLLFATRGKMDSR